VIDVSSGNNPTRVQATDYYSFGLPYAYGTAPERQPYKFGGKELDEMHGLNLYDFEARQKDAILPMFTTLDPLAEKYYAVSPYAYCANNPMRYIDPTGLAWKPTYDEDDHGNKTYNGYEWIDEALSYNTDGNLLSGLYIQAIFFSDNGTFDASSSFNMGSSTATVYLADGTTQTFDANTNPSSSDYATVPKGIYHATVGTHNGSSSSYIALKMKDIGATSNTIELGVPNPAHPERTYAEGIDIHKSGANNKTGMTTSGDPISAGCLLIDRNNWSDFIGIFDTNAQKSNTVSVTVARNMSAPVNTNRVPAFSSFGVRQHLIRPHYPWVSK
jgi:RHS repeat-associated protein